MRILHRFSSTVSAYTSLYVTTRLYHSIYLLKTRLYCSSYYDYYDTSGPWLHISQEQLTLPVQLTRLLLWMEVVMGGAWEVDHMWKACRKSMKIRKKSA